MATVAHPEIGREVRTHGGYYIPREEHLLAYGGREVYYVVGRAVIRTSCCGKAEWTYIQVQGFVKDTGDDKPQSASSVVQVEPITEDEDRRRLLRILLKAYPGARIDIW